jgi:hypothetical protein
MTTALQTALREWVDGTLSAAGLSGEPTECSVGPLQGGPALVAESVSVDRIQDVGSDFNLAGLWGAPVGSTAAPDAVPAPWPELGVALRQRVEVLVRSVLKSPADEPVPQPRLLQLKKLPKVLRDWYEAQPSLPATSPGWPSEPWIVEDANVRLPLLFWSPGFRVAVRYSIHPATGTPEAVVPTLAALATAIRVDRGVDVPLPRFQLPEGLLGLVEALAKATDGDEDLVDLHRRAVGEHGVRVAITPGPDDASSPRIVLAADLLVGRGPRLLPGSSAVRRLSPPTRGVKALGRAGS